MKQRLILTWLLWVFLVGSAFAQSTAGWTQFSTSTGKFSVLAPQKLAESSETRNGVLVYTYQLLQRPMLYMVIYSDYPTGSFDRDTVLGQERDAFVKGMGGGKLQSERQTTYKKGNAELPEIEFTVDATDPNAKFKCRVILDGNRIYFVGFGSIKGTDSAAAMERFLTSFQIR